MLDLYDATLLSVTRTDRDQTEGSPLIFHESLSHPLGQCVGIHQLYEP
jgi:hypothetical protein